MSKTVKILSLMVILIFVMSGCEYRKDMTVEEMGSHKKDLIMQEMIKEPTSETETDTREQNIITTEKTTVNGNEEETQVPEYLGFVDKENICEDNVMEYRLDIFNNPFRVRVVVNSAEVYNSKNELPEYFINSTQYMSYVRPTITDENGEITELEVDTVYLLINVSVKNKSSKDETEVHLSNFEICKFYEDNSGQKYNLSNIRESMLSCEFDYDWSNKHPGLGFYFFDMKAGEEINFNLCFQIAKEELQNDLYICNGIYMGSYIEPKENVMFDNKCSDRKYVKINIDGQ